MRIQAIFIRVVALFSCLACAGCLERKTWNSAVPIPEHLFVYSRSDVDRILADNGFKEAWPEIDRNLSGTSLRASSTKKGGPVYAIGAQSKVTKVDNPGCYSFALDDAGNLSICFEANG